MKLLVTTWYNDRFRTALLVKEGAKYNHVVILDDVRGVVLRRIPSKVGYELNSNIQRQAPVTTYKFMHDRLGGTKAAMAALEA